MNDNELREIRIMLEVLLEDRGLTAWVDSWAVGANNGGPCVSLFSSRLKYRVCLVYHEQFWRLPDFIRSAIPSGAQDLPDTDNDREKLANADARRPEGKKVLRPCTPFLAARVQRGEGDKAAWMFQGVIRVMKERQPEQGKPQEPPPAPPPPEQPSALFEQFNALGHDLYGGSWADVCQRNVQRISGGKTEDSQDLTPEQLQKLISGMMKIKSKRGPEGSPQSARQHVAAQPGYAG